MLFDKPHLITDSIIEKIVAEKPIHTYNIIPEGPNRVGNLICLASIIVIIGFLFYRRNVKKQNNLKPIKQPIPQQIPQQNQPQIAHPNKQQMIQHLGTSEQFRPRQQEHFSTNHMHRPETIPDQHQIHNKHLQQEQLQNENNINSQNQQSASQEILTTDSIKNDRLFDSVQNMPNYKLQEVSLPNINYNNTVNVQETDPRELTKSVDTQQKRELSYDEFEKLRRQEDEDIKHRLNNPNDIDIRKATEYNNKKDHRNEVNMENIKEEVAGEQRMQELELGSGSLTDDSLSFSFL